MKGSIIKKLTKAFSRSMSSLRDAWSISEIYIDDHRSSWELWNFFSIASFVYLFLDKGLKSRRDWQTCASIEFSDSPEKTEYSWLHAPHRISDHVCDLCNWSSLPTAMQITAPVVDLNSFHANVPRSLLNAYSWHGWILFAVEPVPF